MLSVKWFMQIFSRLGASEEAGNYTKMALFPFNKFFSIVLIVDYRAGQK